MAGHLHFALLLTTPRNILACPGLSVISEDGATTQPGQNVVTHAPTNNDTIPTVTHEGPADHVERPGGHARRGTSRHRNLRGRASRLPCLGHGDKPLVGWRLP